MTAPILTTCKLRCPKQKQSDAPEPADVESELNPPVSKVGVASGLRNAPLVSAYPGFSGVYWALLRS